MKSDASVSSLYSEKKSEYMLLSEPFLTDSSSRGMFWKQFSLGVTVLPIGE